MKFRDSEISNFVGLSGKQAKETNERGKEMRLLVKYTFSRLQGEEIDRFLGLCGKSDIELCLCV